MENGAIDYLSFVRGFIAAMDHDMSEPGIAEEPGDWVDADSYAEGFTAGSQPVEHTLIYRELSLQDGGRFSGTLDLLPDELPEQDRRAERGRHTTPPTAPPTERSCLSGTLDFG